MRDVRLVAVLTTALAIACGRRSADQSEAARVEPASRDSTPARFSVDVAKAWESAFNAAVVDHVEAGELASESRWKAESATFSAWLSRISASTLLIPPTAERK